MKTKLLTIISATLLFTGMSFAESQKGTMTDPRDGQTYKTVKIGDQVWMAENLNYKTDNSYCYDNDPANCEKYGRLYKWESAMKACPSGWHLPTIAEFIPLLKNTGAMDVAGKMLKSTSGWDEIGNGVDALGFNVLPAGSRYSSGDFLSAGKSASFWSATEDDESNAYRFHLYYYGDDANLSSYFKDYAGSVRCLRGSN